MTDTTGLFIPGRVKPYVMAHRGNSVCCPENTEAAFRRAVAEGADIIETDLRLTADAQIVCIHDATVDRTTDGHGRVADMTLAELKTLSAGCGMAEYQEQRIPTLEEFLGIVPPPVVCALELKTDDFLDPAVCSRLIGVLDHSEIRRRTLFLSFSWARLEAMRTVAPDIPVGWITYSQWRPMPGVDLLGPYWPWLVANPLYGLLAHWRGQGVCPLDPKPDRRLWCYCLLGCDAVLTNDCGKTSHMLKRYRRLYQLLHAVTAGRPGLR